MSRFIEICKASLSYFFFFSTVHSKYVQLKLPINGFEHWPSDVKCVIITSIKSFQIVMVMCYYLLLFIVIEREESFECMRWNRLKKVFFAIFTLTNLSEKLHRPFCKKSAHFWSPKTKNISFWIPAFELVTNFHFLFIELFKHWNLIRDSFT